MDHKYDLVRGDESGTWDNKTYVIGIMSLFPCKLLKYCIMNSQFVSGLKTWDDN